MLLLSWLILVFVLLYSSLTSTMLILSSSYFFQALSFNSSISVLKQFFPSLIPYQLHSKGTPVPSISFLNFHPSRVPVNSAIVGSLISAGWAPTRFKGRLRTALGSVRQSPPCRRDESVMRVRLCWFRAARVSRGQD